MQVLCLAAVLWTSSLAKEDTNSEDEFKKYKNIITVLTRQVMMQQLMAEESIRATGDSGIKQLRTSNMGTRPYFSATHINSRSVNAIHDHSQNWRTVGMGEVDVVMNGLEFRTRHNDFQLKKPHHSKKKYGATEYVEYPEVPPEVLAKKNLEDQVEEMREWFKAWRDQDYSKRDYRKYFKPVLCYMEGMWTQTSDAIEEPFFSDRHFVDASTWWDLTEKVRFTAYTGRKSNKENYSFLPTKIMNLINNDTEPVFAQWNYKILCAPVGDIPTKYFRIIDDLSARIITGDTLEDYSQTRKARFTLSDFSSKNKEMERQCRYCYLDTLMEKIPGKDNYPGKLADNAFGIYAEHFQRKGERLNTAYYHGRYQGNKAGAMGTVKRNRGFADVNVFMAQTTQTKIPSLKVTDCVDGVCTDYEQRWTYAIPLEIIYLTPLYNWNPHKLSFTSDKKSAEYDEVVADGRNGGHSKEKAYKGTRDNVFYRTPEELFMGAEEDERDPADTSKGTVSVLDPKGTPRKVMASGTRIFLPNMPGVGKLRIRYPISPVHNEGNHIYKEVEALKDIVMRMSTYQHMLREKASTPGDGSGGGGTDPMIRFRLPDATRDPPGLHTHEVEIPKSEMETMMEEGTTYHVDTEEANEHSHSLVVAYDANAKQKWVVKKCDQKPEGEPCWDGHPMYLELES